MSVYKPFNDVDILHTTVQTTPRIIVTSGTNGWRGNTGVSSSLSLYEGIRGRTDVTNDGYLTSGISIYPLDVLADNSADKVRYVSGSYPSTGSINLVTARSFPITDNTVVETNTDWWERHFNPIVGLFEYYKNYNSEYFTGSYDFYCLYLRQEERLGIAPFVWFSGNLTPTISSSYTFEAQIKPIDVITGSNSRNFTLFSQKNKFKFYITSSTGQLAFTDYKTIITSSIAITNGIWHHVAFVGNGISGTFYIDSVQQGQYAFTGTLPQVTGSLIFGAEQVNDNINLGTSFQNGFNGFLFETRAWSVPRTFAQISSSAQTTLYNSSSTDLVSYARFNDSIFSTFPNTGINGASGAFDYSPSAIHGLFPAVEFYFVPQVYKLPNDNNKFYTKKTRINNQIDYFKVIHIPSMFYGRQIATGSVTLTCRAYDNKNIIRVLQDDGRGSLYISGSVTKNISGEDYRGVGWNKVGNVFYSEGLIVLTDPAILDFGEVGKDTGSPNDLLQVSFSGLNKVPVNVFNCRIDTGEFNASNNPTFSFPDPNDPVAVTDKRYLVRDLPTYITSIGLYDENRELVAVAKVAQPIRNKLGEKLNFRLKMDR